MCMQIAGASCEVSPSDLLGLGWGPRFAFQMSFRAQLLLWLLFGHRPHGVQLTLHDLSAQASMSSARLRACDLLTFQKDRKVSGNMPTVVLTVLILHNQLHQKPFKCLIMHDSFTCFTKRTNSIWPLPYQTWQPKTAGEICRETVILRQ